MPQKTKKEKIRAASKSISTTTETKVMDEAMYAKQDLRKTILLTLLILCLEFFVFYATLKHIINF